MIRHNRKHYVHACTEYKLYTMVQTRRNLSQSFRDADKLALDFMI